MYFQGYVFFFLAKQSKLKIKWYMPHTTSIHLLIKYRPFKNITNNKSEIKFNICTRKLKL